jgi:hypothetical protein
MVAMCRRLSELRQSITEYAKGFDANALTPGQAGEVVRVCAQIEASAASIKALAAARSAEGTGWQHDGYRSPAEQLAHDSGMSPAAAKRALEAGRRLAGQPEVASAALAGELSLEQAAAVSVGVSADPTKARHLIDTAQRGSLPELHEEVARIKAAASDQEARHQQQHGQRSLRRWTDLEGALQAHLAGVPEDGARLWRMLDPIRRRLNLLRHHAGTPVERLDALDYDALMLMADIAVGKDGELAFTDLLELGLFPQLETTATIPEPGPSLLPDDPPPRKRHKRLAGSPVRVMIRVDLDTLLRGFPLQGELCEIAGYGPVPVSVIEDLLASESPFIIGLLTKGQELSGVYHHGRHPNAHQRSALDFLNPICAVEGCSARAALQYDHREDYAKTKITAFDYLDRLCTHHHRLKTNHGWGLVEGRHKRAFVPPDDPRHPRFSCPGTHSGPSPPGAA